jgi:hypothetical protein
MENNLAKEGFGKIKAKFANPDSIGPVGVADFLEQDEPEERVRIQREAFELVNRLVDVLGVETYND